jgi:hypothetical protein
MSEVTERILEALQAQPADREGQKA